jgi:hypothetical protein
MSASLFQEQADCQKFHRSVSGPPGTIHNGVTTGGQFRMLVEQQHDSQYFGNLTKCWDRRDEWALMIQLEGLEGWSFNGRPVDAELLHSGFQRGWLQTK